MNTTTSAPSGSNLDNSVSYALTSSACLGLEGVEPDEFVTAVTRLDQQLEAALAALRGGDFRALQANLETTGAQASALAAMQVRLARPSESRVAPASPGPDPNLND